MRIILKVNTDRLIFVHQMLLHCCMHHHLRRVSVSLVSQLAYDAWVTSSKSALKDLKKEKTKRKKEEKKKAKRELQRQEGERVTWGGVATTDLTD